MKPRRPTRRKLAMLLVLLCGGVIINIAEAVSIQCGLAAKRFDLIICTLPQ